MKAKSIKGSSPVDIANQITECISWEFTPTLAIVFISTKQDIEKMATILDEKKISYFGVTSGGEFIDGEIGQGTIAVMLLNIDPAYFKVTLRETGNSTTEEISKQIGAEGKRLFARPAFIIATAGGLNDSEKIVNGIEEAAGTEVMLFGGGGVDDAHFSVSGAFVFSNGKISNDGLVAIILDEDKISINGLATCGWKPVGTLRTVTKSIGNEIYTIDHEPALDLVLKYLGVKFDLDSAAEVLMNIGAYFPLQIQRENAEPIMRSVMSVNQEARSLVCVGNVQQGSKLRFSLPPDFEVIDQVVQDCAELKDTRQNQADVVIMFSCQMRLFSFGATISQEIERVQEIWNCPMIGFFTAGEIGKSKRGKTEFHNNTCCVAVLKEK